MNHNLCPRIAGLWLSVLEDLLSVLAVPHYIQTGNARIAHIA